MLKDRASLWDQVPRTTRLELVPILTTGFLAQGGSLTAAILVRLFTPPHKSPGPDAVSDLTGLFIFLNFVVILWFAYQTLSQTVTKGGEISLNAKIIGLSAAFVTTLELYSYALKSDQPERLAYALLLPFYVFIVPFVLIRRLPSYAASDGTQPQGREIALHALAALELIVLAILACAATVFLCSVYFVIMNDGSSIGGLQLIPSFIQQTLGQTARTEFWVIGPGILGAGWLPGILAVAMSVKCSAGETMTFGLDRKGKVWLIAGAFVINALLAIAAISGSSITLGTSSAPTTLLGLKIVIAVVATTLFLLAFAMARLVGGRTWSRAIMVIVQLITFAMTGALFGLMLMLLKISLGGSAATWANLIWMHSTGFALAYAVGAASLAFFQRSFPDIPPILIPSAIRPERGE